MSVAIKLLLSSVLFMLLFQGMIFSFHLLNLPSTRAVFGGACLLVALALSALLALGGIWSRRWG